MQKRGLGDAEGVRLLGKGGIQHQGATGQRRLRSTDGLGVGGGDRGQDRLARAEGEAVVAVAFADGDQVEGDAGARGVKHVRGSVRR